MTEAGFAQGSHSECVFHHNEKDVRAVAHEDEFTVLGSRVGLDWLRVATQRRMKAKFKARLKSRRPGAVRILSRIVTVTSRGLDYEADQRHEEILMKDMGIDEGSKGVTTPGSKSEGGGKA